MSYKEGRRGGYRIPEGEIQKYINNRLGRTSEKTYIKCNTFS